MIPSIYAFLSSRLSYDPTLKTICSFIPKLSVDGRKALLTVCQGGFDFSEVATVDRAMLRVVDDLVQYSEEYRLVNIATIMGRIQWNHTTRSFVSMLIRNEPFHNTAGAEKVMEDGFIKEFMAGQTRRDEEVRISYQCMDLENYHPAEYSIYYPITPGWIHYAKGFVHRFADRIEKLGILFPTVQRKKNMSTDTCRNLVEAGYETDMWSDLRTLDLELHSYNTGIRVEGNCEMRMAWKFNDLKPRYYYCIGGSNYWRSRYVKPLAVAMMESVPACTLQRRTNPEDIAFALEEDDWICIWDLISFTTSLSELRHFLYYVIRNLEDDLRVQQHPIRCLDYRNGVVSIPAYELLDVYNEGENYGATYSIFRVCEKLFDDYERGDEQFRQQNSGMLGVPGNIGFSTAFHGFHAEAGLKKGTSCNVGDDGLGGLKEDPRNRFIPHLRLIGGIHDEKATIFPPISEIDMPQVFKFVKRRFTRSTHGVSLDYLYSFPPLAEILGVTDDYHTVRPIGLDDLITRFSGQVGAMLWDVHHHGNLDADEYRLLDQVLGAIYVKLGLSVHGSLPGRRHPAFTEGMMFAVPPLFFDYVQNDWAEYLWDHARETTVSLPLSMGPLEIPSFEPGLEFNVSEGAMVNVLEDIGALEKLRMLREVMEVSETNRRVFRNFLSGTRRTYRCRFTSICPSWIDDLYGENFKRSSVYYVASLV